MTPSVRNLFINGADLSDTAKLHMAPIHRKRKYKEVDTLTEGDDLILFLSPAVFTENLEMDFWDIIVTMTNHIIREYEKGNLDKNLYVVIMEDDYHYTTSYSNLKILPEKMRELSKYGMPITKTISRPFPSYAKETVEEWKNFLMQNGAQIVTLRKLLTILK